MHGLLFQSAETILRNLETPEQHGSIWKKLKFGNTGKYMPMSFLLISDKVFKS
jgi:hypothetical protein